ncbi:hypothetical protein SAMN04488058_101401 [Deinococcus reticulitermitis]|uniref:Uncharacterized protein n=1 Tax=Deinococcus reticulitermitis TaxID=856736 RepID=A0A1H6SSG9_9DEIO|nr:hypothetical protein [Deinococcus reticulitermitis]SEI70843.1 hypothetical protein SAMN04488058_101401 [Deinococcus reticulitermitis]
MSWRAERLTQYIEATPEAGVIRQVDEILEPSDLLACDGTGLLICEQLDPDILMHISFEALTSAPLDLIEPAVFEAAYAQALSSANVARYRRFVACLTAGQAASSTPGGQGGPVRSFPGCCRRQDEA